MAYETVTLTVSLIVRTPDFECVGKDAYEELQHGAKGRAIREAIGDALTEQLDAALPTVIVNGVEMKVLVDEKHIDYNLALNATEQQVYDAEAQEEERLEQAFFDEVEERRLSFPEPPNDNYGIYSMGSSIEQLDNIISIGPVALVINDGWGNPEPVYSSVAVSPSKWDMFRLFCEALGKSNDHHHVFLEGVDFVGFEEIDGLTVAIYRAITGS